MKSKKPNIVKDPIFGFKKVDPMPEGVELSNYYEKKYYELIAKGNRANELRKLMAGGEEAEGERQWLYSALYCDIAFLLHEYAPCLNILDVGCGTGELVYYLNQNGFIATGLELSEEAAHIAQTRGVRVYNCSLRELSQCYKELQPCKFDAITMLNVLEHVLNPEILLREAKDYMEKDGVIAIRVPNDFTEIQMVAQKQLDVDPWWVAYPDHVNYFDCQSLTYFLEQLGFEILYMQTDFPMELFLLMGDNYIGSSVIGTQCHAKRVHFDSNISGRLRRKIYHQLALAGIGRNILALAKLK